MSVVTWSSVDMKTETRLTAGDGGAWIGSLRPRVRCDKQMAHTIWVTRARSTFAGVPTEVAEFAGVPTEVRTERQRRGYKTTNRTVVKRVKVSEGRNTQN